MLDATGGHDTAAIRRLWAEVLLRAVEDATAPPPAKPQLNRRRNETKKALAKRIRDEHNVLLVQWRQDRAYIGTPDFAEVCWLAGMDPKHVAERVRPRMAA